MTAAEVGAGNSDIANTADSPNIAVGQRLQLTITDIAFGGNQPGTREGLQQPVQGRPAQPDEALDFENAHHWRFGRKALQDCDCPIHSPDRR